MKNWIKDRSIAFTILSSIVLVIILFSASVANAIPYKQIGDYGKNEINRKNTYQGHLLHQITINDVRFGIGFWPRENVTYGTIPFSALIVWTPEGWITLATMPPLLNDDLGMDMGTPEADLRNYMWFLEQQYNPAMQQYMVSVDALEIPGSNLEKVLYLMESVKFENLRLLFDKEF